MTESEAGRIGEKLDTTVRDVGKLWTAHRELAVVVQGSSGDNGIKSEVVALKEWKEKHMDASVELRNELTHYFDVKRGETCHGLKALDEHIEQHIKMAEAAAISKEGKLKAFMQGWGQVIQLAGLIAVALIAAGRL